MLPVVVGRDEKLVAAAGNSIILLLLTDVLCAASGRRRDRGVKALNEFLLPDHRQRVEEAASLTNLPLEEAARFPCVWPVSCASAARPSASSGR